MYPNISYALLSAALIVLSAVHLILLTVHRPQPDCLSETSIFVLFICVNAVVIGIDLSGLRRGDTPAFYYPLGICTAFPLALEMIQQTKIQAGPLTNALLHRLFLGYGFLSPTVKLGLILCSVAYEASVKDTAVVMSIDYTVLVIAGLLFWRGIRSIPSQGPVICEVTIHAFLVIVMAGFAAGRLIHDWPLWIEAMLIITIVPLPNSPDDTSNLGQLSPHQENRSARLPFILSRDRAMVIKSVMGFGTGATSMTKESYTQLDEVRTARHGSAHPKIRAVVSIYYPDQPTLETGIFTVLCEGSEGDYRRDLRYNELTACSDGEAALQSYRLGFISILAFILAVERHTGKLVGWMLLLHKIGEPVSILFDRLITPEGY
ncbi:hypothetical protein RJZ57_006211 [Blastomyces gilchristii]